MADASFGEQRQSDFDTGAGTDLIEISGIAVPASGGGVVVGGILESGVSAVGALAVGGGTPHDSVDSGNPVKIGGYASLAIPAQVSADGDRVSAWFTRLGALNVRSVDSNGSAVSDPAGISDSGVDAAPNSALSFINTPTGGYGPTPVVTMGYNGTSWDRNRNTQGVTAGANTDLGILAAGIGPGFARIPAVVAATGATTATVSGKGASQVVFNVAGTFTGFAATVQVSYDGTNYLTANTNQSYIDGLGVTAFGSAITATAVVGRVLVNTWGAQQVRLNITAVASGTANVTATANAIGDIPAAAGGAGGTQYVEDAALGAVGTPTGTLHLARAAATVPTSVSADADAVSLWALRNGVLNVRLVDSAGAAIPAGTQYTEDVALGAVGTGIGTLIEARAAAAAPTSVSADADAVGIWASRFGALNVIPRDTVGAALTTTAAALADAFANPTVGGGSAFLVGFNGTTWDRVRTANTGRLQVDVITGGGGTPANVIVDNAAFTDGTSSVGVAGFIFDEVAGTALTENDTAAARIDSKRAIINVLEDATTRGLRAGVVDETGVSAVDTLAVGGGTPHDSVDSGNPVKIGGFAKTTPPTAVATGDRVNAWFGTIGQQSVMISDQNGSVPAAILSGGSQDARTAGQSNVLAVENFSLIHNGGSFDRMRSVDAAVLAVDAKVPGYAAAAIVDADTNARSTVGAFGDLTVGERHVILSEQFSDAIRANLWTTTNANGGTSTATSGETLVQTSANANGSSQVTTQFNIPLLPGVEYGFSILARLNATLTANTRRFGLFTVSGTTPQDGYYFEVAGATLNAVAVKAGAATAVASGSWSRFSTAPFTLDTNYHRWEIDILGDYVVFKIDGIARHILALNPAATRTAVLTVPITLISINVASAATNALLGVRAVDVHRYGGPTASIADLRAAPNDGPATAVAVAGIGPGFDVKSDPAGIAATSTANAVTVPVNGANTIAFHVTAIGTTPGSMILETTSDDTNWATAGMVFKLSAGPDLRVEGSFVPAVNDIYLVRTTGVRQVRYRVNAAYASGTATVKVTASAAAAMVKGTDLAPAPHNIGYALVSVAAQYTSAQTSTTIGPTVSSTQRMVVTYVQIQAGGTVAGTQVTVYFGTGAYSRGTSRTVFDGEFAPSATLKPGAIMSPPVPFVGAADEELKITNVGAINPLTITIAYYLIAA